jgi:[acyl-carrier-protein] S-malonyltransferase
MGRDFYEQSPAAREVFDEAVAMCPGGLLSAIFDGPAEKLADTRVAQPALLTVELAVARHLSELGHVPTVCAGHSLGEISALMVVGTFTLEQVLRIVLVRGRLMAEEVPEGGMMAVVGLPAEAIEEALPQDAQVANYNGPAQTIVSGTKEGLAEAERMLKEAGARRLIPLRVSGPFHSRFMSKAAQGFRAVLNREEFRPPRIGFVSSVSGREETDPDQIRELVATQICRPVNWTAVMREIGPMRAFEVGPGRVLHGLAKRMDGAPAVESAGTLEAVEALEVTGE